jgi:hypothetical protein
MDFNLLYEFGLAGIYFVLISLFVLFYTSGKKGIEYKYLRLGLTAKIIGGISFGLIYMFYYGYGDTFTYFESAKILGDVFIEDPVYGLQLIFEVTDYVRVEDYLYNQFLVNYYRGDDTFTVIKIAGLLSALAFGGYFSTTILFSCFAFFGQWKLYQTFIDRYPNIKFELAVAHFFIPSVVFWGSGIMKDSLVIGFLGLLIYSIDQAFFQGKKKVKSIITILISSYFIYTIKSYVLLALAPAIIFWVFFTFSSKIKNVVVKFVVFPLVFVLVSLLSVYGYLLVESIDKKFDSDRLMEQAYIYQINHYTEIEKEGTRSGYTLGEFDQSFGGMVEKVFPAIGTTLFRPFPWEIKNFVMALSGLESFALTIFTLFVFYKVKIRNLLSYLGSDGFIVLAIVFTLFFAFIVGFSSYNFGALARYKIPCMSFYLSVLFLLINSPKTIKKQGFN